ncbi:MAG: hypothetical protein LC099_11250 [Anaerolineales bacterium]|nr:hypothetical protein [Anaerolineales bacterium]
MQSSQSIFSFAFRAALIVAVVSILASCQLSPAPTEPAPTQESQTERPDLPATFQTDLLNPLDAPHSYVEKTCRYLRNKWKPENAQPGSVVMAILFKEIILDSAERPNSIREPDFLKLMEQLKAQEFEAITLSQFQAFLERNAYIPPRSVLLIQDGNHSQKYFEDRFGSYYKKWGWTVINGYVSLPNPDPILHMENLTLEAEGFVDHQARGVTPDTILLNDTAKTVIARELQGSLKGLSAQFGKSPVAVVWPNGGFGARPVEAARQLNFKIGFTQNQRGPIMYNWIPLADRADPERPTLIPEGKINDPMMTLPTYSPQEAFLNIDVVRSVGKAAAQYAAKNEGAERYYYNVVCAEEFGVLPVP